MRVVICGDAHIGAVFGLGKANKNGGNTRIDDYENTLNYIIDYCIENKVDVFVQTGDAFDSRTPAQEHIEVLDRALKKLSMANITSIVIMGNHDYKRSGDNFTSAITSLPAKDYPNVRLILEPELLKFYDQVGGEANILLMPYRDRRMYSGKSTEEDSNLYQKQIEEMLLECQPDTPTIAVGHNFFYEGSYNDFGGVEVLTKVSAFDKCDMVVMGTHGASGIKKMFLGSNTSQYIANASLPVIAVPATYRFEPIYHLVYASDLHDLTEELGVLTPFAEVFHAALEILYFDYAGPESEQLMIDAKTLLATQPYKNVKLSIKRGTIHLSVAENLKNQIESASTQLLVMVSGEHSWFDNLLIGSNAQQMVLAPEIPLLVLRKGEL
jgi:exonuclease SbcD